MKICFVLPCSGRYPIGGFRIIYEYANRLAARNHDVTLLHLITASPEDMSMPRLLKARLQYVRDKLTGGYRPNTWFALHPEVRTSCHFSFSPTDFEPSDVVIATAWQTAGCVAKLPPERGRKYYFIQHLETWNSEPERLMATWTLPLRKIVIARWLGDVATTLDQGYDLVPNAIDLSFFAMRQPPEARPARSILLQSHKMDWKGTMDAIAALKILRERGVDFTLTLFGLKRPEQLGIDLPHRFVHNPPQAVLRDLYNENAIFVSASWSEGWGLTAHEAAACGAAPVVTDIGGHNEFLVPDQSALMSPPKDARALADNLQRVLEDDTLRIALATRAHDAVQGYTWDRATDAFEGALTGEPLATRQ